MNKQTFILNEFKKQNPNLVLREISKLTGLSLSRVYRIFNGSNMKVKELEIFERLLNQNSNNDIEKKYYSISTNLLKICSTDQLKDLCHILERKIYQLNLLA